MTDATTAPAMPTLADAGELGPPIAPAAAPKPAPVAEHAPTYEQRRHAQEQAAAKPEAAAAKAGNPQEQPAAQDPQAPSTERYKIGAHEISEKELGEMLQRQAAEDLRKATLPATPAEYRAELPADLKLPGNVEYKFDQSNPSLVAARNWAHQKGLSQSEFSEVLAIYAGHEATQNAILAERSRAEILKAGINAPARVDFVGKWLDGFVGKQNAAPIKATLVTNAHLEMFEAVISKLTTQGTASFSQSHRTAPDANGIPGYETMSFEQRRYAQDQIAARRR
jgi:hypothetical protein